MKKKNQFSSFLSGLLGCILLLALFTFALFFAPSQASALEFVTGSVNVASGLTVTSNTTATSTSGTALEVPPNTDLWLFPSIISTGAGTSNSTFYLNISPGGSVYTTTYPITLTAVANTGTTRATGATFIPRTNLTRYIRLDKIATTQAAPVTNLLYYGYIR